MPRTKALPPHLEEVKVPSLSDIHRFGRGRHTRLLQDISQYPNRWFVVKKYLLPLTENGTLGLSRKENKRAYMRPQATRQNLAKRFSKDGFEFAIHQEKTKTHAIRVVIARYNPKRSK